MGLEEDVLRRLRDEEDLFVERKSMPGAEEIRKVVVAFANGLPSGDTGVLFIGVDTHGVPNGKVADPDQLQRDVRTYLQNCSPQIDGLYTCALCVNELHVVAIEVAASRNRPHFTGPAWVRKGSETVRAFSESLLEQMIDDRNDLCWMLRPWVDKCVTVCQEGYTARGLKEWGRRTEAQLKGVNRFHVEVLLEHGKAESYSLRRVMLERDTAANRPLLRVAMSALG